MRKYLKSETYKNHEIKVFNRGSRFTNSRYVAFYEDNKLQYNRAFTHYGATKEEAVNEAKNELDSFFIGKWRKNIVIGDFYFEQIIKDRRGHSLVIASINKSAGLSGEGYTFHSYYFKTKNMSETLTQKYFKTYEQASKFAIKYLKNQKLKKIGIKKVIEVN